MRFIRSTMEDLEMSLKNIQADDAVEVDHTHWDSYYVVRTEEGEGDIALSTPNHTDSLGIYFQPRAGTGGPVIMWHQVTELYRVEL